MVIYKIKARLAPFSACATLMMCVLLLNNARVALGALDSPTDIVANQRVRRFASAIDAKRVERLKVYGTEFRYIYPVTDKRLIAQFLDALKQATDFRDDVSDTPDGLVFYVRGRHEPLDVSFVIGKFGPPFRQCLQALGDYEAQQVALHVGQVAPEIDRVGPPGSGPQSAAAVKRLTNALQHLDRKAFDYTADDRYWWTLPLHVRDGPTIRITFCLNHRTQSQAGEPPPLPQALQDLFQELRHKYSQNQPR